MCKTHSICIAKLDVAKKNTGLQTIAMKIMLIYQMNYNTIKHAPNMIFIGNYGVTVLMKNMICLKNLVMRLLVITSRSL